MGFVEKLFGSHSDHEIKRIQPQLKKILALKPEMEKLSDEALRDKTTEFRQRLAAGETLDDLLVEAYAVVREAARRVLGMEPFPVQIMVCQRLEDQGGWLRLVFRNNAGELYLRKRDFTTGTAAAPFPETVSRYLRSMLGTRPA